MSIESDMRVLLAREFSPVRLEITNDSAKHAGHAGAGGAAAGETHFSVLIESDAFKGLSRVERHRRVNALMAPLFGHGLHALSMRVLAVGEK